MSTLPSDDAMTISGLSRRAVLASRNVLLALVCVFALTQTMTWVNGKLAYSTYYDLLPGQYNGYRVTQLSDLEPGNTCLILGASTAREGFDIAQFEKLLPGTNLVTLATSAGVSGVWVVDVQSRSIPDPSAPYKCIVVAMHPFFIYEMSPKTYELESWNYDSQLPLNDLYTVMAQQKMLDAAGWQKLTTFALLPNAKHAGILNKHLRRALYDMKSIIKGSEVERSVFEVTKGDLEIRQSNIRYSDSDRANQNASLERRQKWIDDTHHDDPERYKDSAAQDILISTMKRLSLKTDRLIVMDLPATPVFDRTLEASRPAFEKSLKQSGALEGYYKCKFIGEDRYLGFVDSIHSDSSGRAALTESLASILSVGKQQNNICPQILLK